MNNTERVVIIFLFSIRIRIDWEGTLIMSKWCFTSGMGSDNLENRCVKTVTFDIKSKWCHTAFFEFMEVFCLAASNKTSNRWSLKDNVICVVSELIQDISTCHEQIAEHAAERIQRKDSPKHSVQFFSFEHVWALANSPSYMIIWISLLPKKLNQQLY